MTDMDEAVADDVDVVEAVSIEGITSYAKRRDANLQPSSQVAERETKDDTVDATDATPSEDASNSRISSTIRRRSRSRDRRPQRTPGKHVIESTLEQIAESLIEASNSLAIDGDDFNRASSVDSSLAKSNESTEKGTRLSADYLRQLAKNDQPDLEGNMILKSHREVLTADKDDSERKSMSDIAELHRQRIFNGETCGCRICEQLSFIDEFETPSNTDELSTGEQANGNVERMMMKDEKPTYLDQQTHLRSSTLHDIEEELEPVSSVEESESIPIETGSPLIDLASTKMPAQTSRVKLDETTDVELKPEPLSSVIKVISNVSTDYVATGNTNQDNSSLEHTSIGTTSEEAGKADNSKVKLPLTPLMTATSSQGEITLHLVECSEGQGSLMSEDEQESYESAAEDDSYGSAVADTPAAANEDEQFHDSMPALASDEEAFVDASASQEQVGKEVSTGQSPEEFYDVPV